MRRAVGGWISHDLLSEGGQVPCCEVHLGFRDMISVPILQVIILIWPCPYGLGYVRGQRGALQVYVNSETSTFSIPSLAVSLAAAQAQALNAGLQRAELGISAMCQAGVSWLHLLQVTRLRPSLCTKVLSILISPPPELGLRDTWTTGFWKWS